MKFTAKQKTVLQFSFIPGLILIFNYFVGYKWNYLGYKEGVDFIDSMKSPLLYRSLGLLTNGIIFSFPFIIKRERDKAIAFFVIGVVTQILLTFIFHRLGNQDHHLLRVALGFFPLFAIYGIVRGLWHRNGILPVVVLFGCGYFVAAAENCYHQFSRDVFRLFYREIDESLTYCIGAIMVPFVLYYFIYLGESFAKKDNFEKAKGDWLGLKNYLPVGPFIGGYWLYFILLICGIGSSLSFVLNTGISYSIWGWQVNMLINGLVVSIGSITLLSRLVMRRLKSTNRIIGLKYLFSFTPFINLIPFFILLTEGKEKQKKFNFEDNGRERIVSTIVFLLIASAFFSFLAFGLSRTFGSTELAAINIITPIIVCAMYVMMLKNKMALLYLCVLYFASAGLKWYLGIELLGGNFYFAFMGCLTAWMVYQALYPPDSTEMKIVRPDHEDILDSEMTL